MALLILNADDLDIDACCVLDHCHLSAHDGSGPAYAAFALRLGCPR